jgi:type II secretory pathway pseudopilin PulG
MPLLFCRGFRRNAPCSITQPRRRIGATLLELIIVLFIIGLMASLLFPALQAARRKAKGTECQNNVRQLGTALEQCIQSWKRLPAKGRWTVDILPWIEEKPLAEQVANGIPPNTVLPRPALYRCDDQPDVASTVPSVFVCHYIWAVDRESWASRPERTPWNISDRYAFKKDETYDPWYVGTEISLNNQRIMFTTMQGPHPGSLYYMNDGGTAQGP